MGRSSDQDHSHRGGRGTKPGLVTSATLGSLLAGLVLSGSLAFLFERSSIQEHRQQATELTREVSFDIQEHLNRSLSATYALSAVIRQGHGDIDNFRDLAKEMLQLYPGLSALQIAPGGVVTQSVPLEGNEKAIGHNLLEDTARNKEALLALRTRALTLAGPFRLIQGGQAVVGRLPVFLTDPGGRQRFWGFSIALIRIPLFLQDVGVRKAASHSCNLELSRIHPDTGNKEVFFSTGGPLRQPVSRKIPVPNGEWTLSVAPVGGWYRPGIITLEAVCVLVFSGLLALGVRRLVRQPIVLKQMVDQRTREISEANLALQAEIQDRERAQEALLDSEHKLRSICTSLNEVILILDREGHYLEVAATHSNRLYLPSDQLVGKRLSEIFPPQEAGFFLATIHQALASQELVSVDYPLSIDGQVRWFAGNVAPLSPTTVVWSARDITRRKDSEVEQRKLEQQLLHTQKLESLGVLAGGIAHDFNNILMAILGNAGLGLLRVDPQDPVAKHLQQIEQAAARAADLTRQMLAYSGRGSFIVEPVDLNRLLREMLSLLELSVSKMAVLRLDLPAQLPTVEADASQIHQIVMNLVINASEAIGERSGVIAISTGTLACDRRYLEDAWLSENIPEGRYVFLQVADNGCGMDTETLGKIFDPFFTTKFTGRGLGMAAVLGIVRGHKGAIKVTSQPGKGSTFQVLLPVSSKAAELAEGEAPPVRWKGEGTVLLVDDEETVRSVGKEMLSQLGFTPITASNGKEALAAFRTVPGISFVILDLSMPHMSGEECLGELRRLDPEVKVIMSSGYNEAEVAERFRDRGLAGFIQKPYNLSALRQVLMRQEASATVRG